MANPSWNHQESSLNGNSAPQASATALALKYNPGVSLDWTPEEQAVLEGLSKYASETNIRRYVKVALRLSNKTARDVALRVMWMNEKVDDAAAKLSQLAAQLGVSSYAPTMMMDNDNGISSNAIGVPTDEEILSQISANLDAGNLQDNIELFCQARDDIHKILNDLNMAEVMRGTPPVPNTLNESMLNSILPGTSQQMQ